jgi:hypothetical protein
MRFSSRVSAHEVGHAVVALALGIAVDEVRVLLPRGRRPNPTERAGWCKLDESPENMRQPLVHHLAVTYAGPLAEARYTRRSLVACYPALSGDALSARRMLDRVRSAARRGELSRHAAGLAHDALCAHWDSLLTFVFILQHRGWLERPSLNDLNHSGA